MPIFTSESVGLLNTTGVYEYEGGIDLQLTPSSTSHEYESYNYGGDVPLKMDFGGAECSFHKLYVAPDPKTHFHLFPSSNYFYKAAYEYEGDLNLNISPDSLINTDLEYTGDLSLDFTLNSVVTTELIYNGDLSLDLNLGSVYSLLNAEFPYVGDLGLSLALNSNYSREFVYDGDLQLDLSVNSYFAHGEILSEYVGDLTLDLTLSSIHNQVQVYDGNVGLNIDVSSDYSKKEQFLEYYGNIGIQFNLSSEYIREYEYEGELGLSFTPNSATGFGEGYFGDVSIDIGVSSEYSFSPAKEYVGNINLDVDLDSTYSFIDIDTYSYVGNVYFELLPVSVVNVELIYGGELGIALECNAITSKGDLYLGQVPLNLELGSNYSFENQEFIYQGNLDLEFITSHQLIVELIYRGDLELDLNTKSPSEFRADSQVEDTIELEFERKTIELEV